MSPDDIDAQKILDNDTKLVNNRYQVPMLWKDSSAALPNNYSIARKRFKFLETRLRSNKVLYQRYREVIHQYIEKGYARKLTDEEANKSSQKTWYLPHHPVFNPNKPGKVRVVKDAAAECQGVSLNKALITGPDLLNSLAGILIRFRIGKIALVADIEAMFHQVRVTDADADSLRFLWKDEIYSSEEPFIMQMLVHIFGAKDSTNCAIYALRKTGRDNHHSHSALAYETILKAFYVDDLLKSLHDTETAVSLANELICLAKRGGFRLTKFMSNEKAVLKLLPKCEVSQNPTYDLRDENVERALGICWDTANDVFTFFNKEMEVPKTKREILRVTSSLFDPLGFINPFILKSKILLQELWRKGCDWDEEVDEEVAAYWDKWLTGAKNVSVVKLNRCYVTNIQGVSEIQLHVFCDASEMAYGSVGYLRYSFKDGSHECSLVMAKSKLAPIKTISLPRLELNGAVTATRLGRTLLHEVDLPIVRVCFWTDSTLVLQYVQNKTRRFKTYIANRVTEILESSQVEQWGHVGGNENPADLLTRGVFDPVKLLETSKHGTTWFSGPEFLHMDEPSWPTTLVGELPDDDCEIKPRSVLIGNTCMQYQIFDATRVSSWTKLKRIVGWILRFIHNCRKRNGLSRGGGLSCEELESAETKIIFDLQRVSFQEELHTLRSGKTLSKRHRLALLTPYIDPVGIMRVGGRLDNAPIQVTAQHQAIIPKNHPVTTLIIMHDHRSNGHIGPEHILANLRQSYWIPNGRVAIKAVLRNCLLCRIRRAKLQYPFMANLPASRMAYDEPPFSSCGVDLFGPLYIKHGRQRPKRWVVLFVCMTIRCIHLEVSETMDTDDFINALRRFTNRRGFPKSFHSDNGTNFKGATKELKEVVLKLDQRKITEFATSKNVLCKLNPLEHLIWEEHGRGWSAQ